MWRVREARQEKQTHGAVFKRSHGRVCDRAGNSAQTCQLRSSPLHTSPHWLLHCICSIFQHWWDKERGGGGVHLLLCPLPISLFPPQAITPIFCVQNLLQLLEANKHQFSLNILVTSSQEKTETLSLGESPFLQEKETVPKVSLMKKLWVRMTLSKVNKWNAAVVGSAVAKKHP